MVHFSSPFIKSILTPSIIIRYAAANAKDKGRLQCVIHSAETVFGFSLHFLLNMFTSKT